MPHKEGSTQITHRKGRKERSEEALNGKGKNERKERKPKEETSRLIVEMRDKRRSTFS